MLGSGLEKEKRIVDEIDEEDEEEEDDDEEEEEEDGEDGSSDDEDEEEEAMEEPRIRYDRIRQDVSEILHSDAASCLAAHEKFLALGTHWGVVHILDHQGNRIREREFPAHSTTINALSIDEHGDYVASCSDDGQVVINGLYSTDHNTKSGHDFPVRSVALDPLFGRRRDRRYVIGGSDQLVLHERGLFGLRGKTTLLHAGEGPVRTIKWQGSFIAWANDVGVKVYDCASQTRISYVPREEKDLRPEMYPCNLCWRDAQTLLIGWGNAVKVCRVKERPREDVRDLPPRYIELQQHFQIEFFIAGISMINNDLAVLSYLTNDQVQKTTKAQRPQLRIISFREHPEPPLEVAADVLSIRGYEEYRCTDYKLELVRGENLLFIISPKDIIRARPRDIEDHIEWRVQHGEFEEALAMAKENERTVKEFTAMKVGRLYMEALIKQGKYDKAAKMCHSVLGRDVPRWEKVVSEFAELGQLQAIAPYMPLSGFQLGKAYYEMILNDFLQRDPVQFVRLLKSWPPNLYDIPTVMNVLQASMNDDEENKYLWEAQAHLNVCSGHYDKALRYYLQIGHEDVLGLIQERNLFGSIQDNVALLIDSHGAKAIDLLVDNTSKIPVADVVAQLSERRELRHQYLHAVFIRKPRECVEFEADLVELYADFDQEGLLNFLRSSNSYPLEKALAICEVRELHEARVYLLTRMGNARAALKLIIEKLGDVAKAIDFATEQNDDELWEDLIAYSVDKPHFITGLLRKSGTHINPQLLISRIEAGMVIPGLRDSLVKILQDYNLQKTLRFGFKKILVNDSTALLKRLNRTQRAGVMVDWTAKCPACQGSVLHADATKARNIAVFFDHRVYHEECAPKNVC